jgi:hypothetical protein
VSLTRSGFLASSAAVAFGGGPAIDDMPPDEYKRLEAGLKDA